MSEKKFVIKGMHCKSCSMLIEDILEDMDIKVKSLTVDDDKKEGTLLIDTDQDPNKIKETIEAEGDYTVSLVA